ncbi:MAG: D-TA family PLP-dependent enzyme [Clostridia bacterium]
MENIYSFIGQTEVFSPSLIYYKDIIKDNIQKTIDLAGSAEKLFPHVKTHKMAEVVKMQIEMGINNFKCATIAEAEMTACVGAKQIILAYPLVGPNISRFVKLVKTFPNTKFYAIADNNKQVELLSGLGIIVNLLVDVDMGQHRTGVNLNEAEIFYKNCLKLKDINVSGFHCYDGHIHQSSLQERNNIVTINNEITQKLVTALSPELVVCGGTPSFSSHTASNMNIFYSPGTCIINDFGYASNYLELTHIPAAVVLGRVISRPSKNTFTLDIGVKAIASDPKAERGQIVGFEYAKTVIQNEEHWVLEVPENKISEIPEIGEILFAIPTHVCPTSVLYPSAIVVENGQNIGNWEVTARNRFITI